MAIIATPGASDANSYGTAAEADAYFATRPFSTAWTSLVAGPATTAIKEAALIMATRTIDARVCFNGVSASSTQALRWPMNGALSRNGFVIPSDQIPQPLKDAVFEMALLLLGSDVTLQNAAAAQGIASLSAGPVSIAFRDGPSLLEEAIGMSNFKTVPENVRLMLVPSWLCEVPTNKGGGIMFRMT